MILVEVTPSGQHVFESLVNLLGQKRQNAFELTALLNDLIHVLAWVVTDQCLGIANNLPAHEGVHVLRAAVFMLEARNIDRRVVEEINEPTKLTDRNVGLSQLFLLLFVD